MHAATVGLVCIHATVTATAATAGLVCMHAHRMICTLSNVLPLLLLLLLLLLLQACTYPAQHSATLLLLLLQSRCGVYPRQLKLWNCPKPLGAHSWLWHRPPPGGLLAHQGVCVWGGGGPTPGGLLAHQGVCVCGGGGAWMGGGGIVVGGEWVGVGVVGMVGRGDGRNKMDHITIRVSVSAGVS